MAVLDNTAYESFGSQGVHYEDIDNGKIYIPMWGTTAKPNENVVLVYRNINSNSPSLVNAFKIDRGTSSDVKLEIEGIGFPKTDNTSVDNVLWFSTYERNRNGGIYTDIRTTIK